MTAIKYFVFVCCALAIVACSDDEVAPGATTDVLVTRISRDGVTALELFYDLNKSMYRMNYFNAGGSLSSYYIYDYDEKGIKESRRYKGSDHSLEYRTVFTLDNYGRVIKGENYSTPDFEDLSSISDFDYNPSGQLVTREFRSAGSPVYYRDKFTYDDGGNLIGQVRTYLPGQTDEYIGAQYDFVPGDRAMPDHWKLPVFLLSISGTDTDIRQMFNSGETLKFWNADQEATAEYSYMSSGHQFNGTGNVTRQVITRSNVLHPENPDVASEMTYNYAE